MTDISSNLPTFDKADGTAGSSAPAQSIQIAGVDLSNILRAIRTDSSGNVIITEVDGYKASYSACAVGLAPGGTTDIFTLTGSGTKTIRVLRVEVSFTQSHFSTNDFLLIKRSTANSGGTSTAQTAVGHDSNNAAATATVLAYTVSPTSLGTAVGTLRAVKLFGDQINQPDGESILIWDFGTRPSQAIVLRGSSQVVAINLNSSAIAGDSINISIEWTEE